MFLVMGELFINVLDILLFYLENKCYFMMVMFSGQMIKIVIDVNVMLVFEL